MTPPSPAGPSTGPFALLMKSIEELPAMKYALGVGALVAVAAMIQGFNVNLKIAPFAAIIMLVLMVVLVVFAGLAAQSASALRLPIIFFTWSSLLLIIATALVLFTSAFWKKPVDLALLLKPTSIQAAVVDPRPDSLIEELKTLEDAFQDPDDTWMPFVRDYSDLVEITVVYLHYVEDNKDADPGNKVATELDNALKIIKTRNGVDRTRRIRQPDGSYVNPQPEYQAETIPGIFHELLIDIKTDKSKGISSPKEICYETALRRFLVKNAGFENNRSVWLINSGFQDSLPVISAGCRTEITIPSGL
jgi:hypothetical protein